MGICMLIIALIIAIKRKYPRGKGYTLKEGLVILLDGSLAMFTALIVVGGVIIGIFTATEAAAFAVLYAFIVTFFIYREAPFSQVYQDPLFLAQNTGHRHEPDRCCERLWVSARPFAGAETGHGVAPLDYGQLLFIAPPGQYHAPHPGMHYGHGTPHPHLHPDSLSCPGSERWEWIRSISASCFS